jgi:hypothetical protein
VLISVPDPDLVQPLRTAIPDAEVVLWRMDGPPPASRIDIVVPPYTGLDVAYRSLPGVDTWLVQGQAIGYEVVEPLLPEGYRFANAATVHETATAELAVALTLAAQRGLAGFLRDGLEGRWRQHSTPGLADRRILLLGYGGVGRGIAARLAGFEASVTPVASRARTQDGVSVRAVAERRERQRRIIEQRFGFDSEPASLETIGKELGLTRERVRQLESDALARLQLALGDELVFAA